MLDQKLNWTRKLVISKFILTESNKFLLKKIGAGKKWWINKKKRKRQKRL
jgi:hypothetical protein